MIFKLTQYSLPTLQNRKTVQNTMTIYYFPPPNIDFLLFHVLADKLYYYRVMLNSWFQRRGDFSYKTNLKVKL
jgi:hypothetical protein